MESLTAALKKSYLHYTLRFLPLLNHFLPNYFPFLSKRITLSLSPTFRKSVPSSFWLVASRRTEHIALLIVAGKHRFHIIAQYLVSLVCTARPSRSLFCHLTHTMHLSNASGNANFTGDYLVYTLCSFSCVHKAVMCLRC